MDFEWDGTDFTNFKLNEGYGWVNYLIWTHFTNNFLENKEAVDTLQENQEILGIGDGVLVYWDQDNNMRILGNEDNGVCIIGNFTDDKFNLKPVLSTENVNRNI